jgi:hypothetical protein
LSPAIAGANIASNTNVPNKNRPRLLGMEKRIALGTVTSQLSLTGNYTSLRRLFAFLRADECNEDFSPTITRHQIATAEQTYFRCEKKGEETVVIGQSRKSLQFCIQAITTP